MKFVSTVSKMGDDKIIINIPKELHDEMRPYIRKQVKITVDEI